MTLTTEQERELVIAEAEFEFSKKQQPSTVSDVYHSIPQYAETAASTAAGIPGDIAKGIGMGIEGLGNLGEWAAEQTIGPGHFVGAKPDYSKAYGSEDVQNKFNQMQGGQLYQPQTTGGKIGNEVARFVPLMAGGGGGVLAKGVTRAIVPGTLTEAVKESPLPEEYKPWAEGAVALLSPFGANKAVGSTLNRLKRNELMKATGKLPDDIDSLIPSRLSGGTIPTIKQIEATRDALTGIARIPGPQQAQAVAAAAEMSKRLQAMKVVNKYVTVKGITYNNAQIVKDQLGNLASAVKGGKHKGVFTSEQVAQLEKAAEGTLPAQAVEAVGKLAPSAKALYGAGGIGFAAHSLIPNIVDFEKLAMVVAPGALGMVAKAAYPQMTKNQIQRFVASVKKGTGRDVPGAPPFSPSPVTPPSYSPLTPGMAINPFVDEEQ